jgi:UDP:flavonoid glycosyltransferase YjiC (YdhE family)
MSALLTVLREVHLPSLVYVPDGDPAWLAQFQSPLLRFTTAPVDIRQVARHCDLAILNGNAGTATDLLLNGVPQLHVPLYLEQEVFSRRVVDLGAALLAAPNRPEQFAVRLTTMIHGLDQFGEAAAKFAAKYAAFDAERSIAEIVSRIAE